VNFLFSCINGICLSQQNASGLPGSTLPDKIHSGSLRTGLYANFKISKYELELT